MLTDPSGTGQCFGGATIAVARKGGTSLLDGLTKPLIIFLVRRWTAMLIVPLSVDPQ